MGVRRRLRGIVELAASPRRSSPDPGGAREAQALAALGDRALSERQYLDAVRDLRTYGTEASVGALCDALAWTGHKSVTRAAVMALGRIGSPAAIDAIIASLDFCDSDTVFQAAFILRVRDERRAIPALVNCAVERGEELGTSTLLGLLRQLCWMPSQASVEPLAPVLRHRSRKIRREAAKAIGVVGDASALAALDAAATDLGWIRGFRAGTWAEHLRKTAPVSAPEDQQQA